MGAQLKLGKDGLPRLSPEAARDLWTLAQSNSGHATNVNTCWEWRAWARQIGLNTRDTRKIVRHYFRQYGGPQAYVLWADDRVTRFTFRDGRVYSSTAQPA